MSHLRRTIRASRPRTDRVWEHRITRYRSSYENRTSTPGAPPRAPAPRTYGEGVDAMGRGRQKAKQTKVARQLKYFSPETDYTALANELHSEGKEGPARPPEPPAAEEGTGDDEYADWESSYR